MFITFCPFWVAHFAREALSLYGIARLHLANMLITLGVQLPIFLVLQNAC